MRLPPIAALLVCLHGQAWADGQTASLPNATIDAPLTKTSVQEEAVFAGGCFWGVQAVFQHVRGVVAATSGYAGGTAATAKYEIVSSGATGHAESVQILYDPGKITYGQLLRIYFAVAHNPTELNHQGPDTGTQYRSEIFSVNAEQQRIAEAYIVQLDAAHIFPRRIVTKVTSLSAFYPAEDYHQNYAALHPDSAYIVINELPKVEHLREAFPDLYR